MFKLIVPNVRMADCCESCFYSKPTDCEDTSLPCTYGVAKARASTGEGVTDSMIKTDICDAYVRANEEDARGMESVIILKDFIQRDPAYGDVKITEYSNRLIVSFDMICKYAPDMFLYKRGNYPEITKDFKAWFHELITKHIPDKVLGWSHQ